MPWRHSFGNRLPTQIWTNLHLWQVFTLIRDHDLFGSLGVSNRIPDLMDLDARESVKMFLEYREKLDPGLATYSIFSKFAFCNKNHRSAPRENQCPLNLGRPWFAKAASDFDAVGMRASCDITKLIWTRISPPSCLSHLAQGRYWPFSIIDNGRT